LHVILPFIILIILFFHLYLLHKAGSTPGTQSSDPEGIGFHPYFSVKDIYGLSTSFILYGYLIFFAPNRFGHPDNYIPADPLVTPTHIVPEWYFTPFYAILRAFPDKTLGIIAMLFAIIILAVLPFMNYYTSVPVIFIKKN
jgi:ubiquinol-cytochrome c reductase cytochrome b subunit